MLDGYRVADVDTHQMEPDEIWERYIDPRFRDRRPRPLRVGTKDTMEVEGEAVTSEGDQEGKEGKYAFSPPEFVNVIRQAAEERFKSAKEAGYNAASRLRDMDASGVDVQILYPTKAGLLLGKEFRDPALLAACCRAYNDWSREYCQAAPKRLRWAAVLPAQDVERSVSEVERTAGLGAVSFYLRPNPTGGRPYYHPDYRRLWAAIEETGLAVSFHDAGSPRIPSFGDRMDSHATGHIISHPFEAMACIVGLTWFGVFERFPGLRVVHVECDAGWLPYLMQRMEQHYEFLGNAEHPDLHESPNAYVRRNVSVAARGDEVTLPAVVELAGDDNLMFNTDYPHTFGNWPDGMKQLLDQPIDDSSKRKILWDNAARVFDFEPLPQS